LFENHFHIKKIVTNVFNWPLRVYPAYFKGTGSYRTWWLQDQRNEYVCADIDGHSLGDPKKQEQNSWLEGKW
jgi:hypothetical protein